MWGYSCSVRFLGGKIDMMFQRIDTMRMFAEKRLVHRRLRPDIDVEIEWDPLQKAGDTLMAKDVLPGRRVERGFLIAGTLVANERGRCTARVKNLLDVGTGTAAAFDVTPELAARLNAHEHQPGERTLGMAHSHPDPFPGTPSGPDLRMMQEYANTMIAIVLKANPDGSGQISVFDGDGYVPYTIAGANAQSQFFPAEERGRVDVERLRDPEYRMAA